MGVNCTKMGKTKIITPTSVPSTPTSVIKNSTPSDYGTTNRATNSAPAYKRQPSALTNDGDIMWEELEKELQENNLNNLREDLYKNPEQFILTNILMSTQFFKNFERDKEESSSQIDAEKRKFDEKLTDIKKNVIIPRGIFSKIFEYVTYKNANGVTLEPLYSEDCIVNYDNVEPYRTEELQRLQDGSMQYFQVDTTIYRVCVDAAKNSGYVKLVCVDEQLTRRSSINPRGSSDETVSPEISRASSHKGSEEASKQDFDENKSIAHNVIIDNNNYVSKKKSQPPINNRDPSDTSANTLSPPRNELIVDDGIYGYAYSNSTPLKEFSSQEARGSLIGSNCFRYTEVTINDDLDEFLSVGEKERRCYLSSSKIMDLFQNQFYEISSKIEKRHLTNSAKVLKPDVICREEIDDSVKEMMWRFTPSIEVGFWPDEGFEWFLRPRNVMRCKRTGMKYQWPSPEMTSAVRQLGCNIVPIGFCHPRKEIKNPESDLEWELRFSKAEIFMTRNLHHPKIRAYLFMVLLYKEYFEQFSGITERHIRYIFYWLVENSPADWIEENIGEKFLLLIRRLELHLKKQKLPNYFLKNCNMFANIPNHKLRAAQEKVHRILENPIFFLLQSLSNLEFDTNFYPNLDIHKLYLILTTENQLTMINPALLGSLVDDDVKTTKKSKQRNDAVQVGDKYQQRMRMNRSQLELKAAKHSEASNDEPKINVNAKVMPFDEPRRKLLLEFFISHFIKMSKKSNIFRNPGQATLYLLHSENLLKILTEMGFEAPSLTSEVRKLRDVKSPSNIKDYWSISFGHRQLYTRSPHNSLSLPDVPAGHPSPIPGTFRPGLKDDTPGKNDTKEKKKKKQEKGQFKGQNKESDPKSKLRKEKKMSEASGLNENSDKMENTPHEKSEKIKMKSKSTSQNSFLKLEEPASGETDDFDCTTRL